MQNSVADLMILRGLGVAGRTAPPHTFLTVIWRCPAVTWIKANIDGLAVGAPGAIACGGLFRNSRGFVIACFH